MSLISCSLKRLLINTQTNVLAYQSLSTPDPAPTYRARVQEKLKRMTKLLIIELETVPTTA